MQTNSSTIPSHETCSQVLKAAVKRYNAILSDEDSEWIRIKSQTIPRSSRILLYKQKGDSAEAVYKVVLECLTRSDRHWTLGGWHSLFANVSTRGLWDHMVDEVQILDRSSTPRMLVTRRVPNRKIEASNVADDSVVCVEKTTRRKNCIRHIATAITDTKSSTLLPGCPKLAAYDIRMSPDDDPGLDSRVTLYYQANIQKSGLSTQQMRDILEPYIITLITEPLSFLSFHGSPPYIARRESSIYDSATTSYNHENRHWTLQYRILTTSNSHKPSISPSSTAVNIKRNHYTYMPAAAANQWQSASWERERMPIQLTSSLHHRKNSFMSTSGLIKPSYSAISIRPHSPKQISKTYSANPHKQARCNDDNNGTEAGTAAPLRSDIFSSSYTFGTHNQDGSMEDNMPDIVIELDHRTWSSGSPIDLHLSATIRSRDGSLELPMQHRMIDKFAQFCVRCYRQRSLDGWHRYFVTLHHTPEFLQYITDELRQDVDALEGTCDVIEAKLELHPRKQQQQQQLDDTNFELLVNGNEWPFRLWESRSWSADDNNSSTGYGGSVDAFDTDNELETSDSESIESSESRIQSDVENGVFNNEMEDIESLDHSATITAATNCQDTSTSSIILEPLNSSKPLCAESTKEDIINAPMQKQEDEELPPLNIEMDIPVTDPPQLLKMHHYFDSLLQRTGWSIVQEPEETNMFGTIKKIDVSGHPTGAFLNESTWKDCSVWDVKAVVCSVGARKIWDSTLEDSIFVTQVSPTCSIWHHKTKGFWPVSARDYVAFSGYYGTPTRVDLCATTCSSESFGHTTLPKEQPGYVRARLDLWAWRLERLDNSSTSVKLINQANLQGWIPSYIPNSFSGHTPNIIMQAHQYFKKHGAPPDLIVLQHGSLVDISYDHSRSSWRCEYIRSAEGTIAITASMYTQANSTKAEIRLDGRRRTDNNSYNVVVDPPPTRVRATKRTYDPYGWWLEIEHDEEHIIPQRGKILALIKPSSALERSEGGEPELVINGVPMPLQKGTASRFKLQGDPAAEQQVQKGDHPQEQLLQQQQLEEQQQRLHPSQQPDSLESIVESLPVSPMEHTQHSIAFLERMADQQFGWTNISDKNNMHISKRQGSKFPNSVIEPNSEAIIIPDQSAILKASKVIEGFSVEEISSIVTDTGKLRRQYDDSIEEIETLLPLTHGCTLVRQVIKGGLFLKAKEAYASVCTAVQKVPSTTNVSAKRVLHIETSIPSFPVPKSSKRQQILFYISGWVLEAIDPYTTTNNYPIPSTRATFVATIDLGTAVPSFLSNQITLGLHKKIRAIENYLKQHGSPPYLIQPLTVEGFSGGKFDDRVVKELYPELGAVEWISVSSSFDPSVNSFKSAGEFRLLLPKRSASLALSKASNLSAVLKSKPHVPQSMASSPTFSTTAFKRKQSIGGDTKETMSIQTSISSDAQSRGSGEASGDLLVFHAIVDLRSYPKGYEISTRLIRRGDEQKKDLSASLLCHVSERAPEPSQLIAGSKASQKHAIEILIHSGSRLGRDRDYVLEMSLTRVQEESLNKRGTRLTVSGVLGEEDNQWRGLLLLNGREIEIGTTECAAMTLPEELPLLEEENGQDESAEEDEEAGLSGVGKTNMGGGVVAAAIGGVSAGVSDIRARMLMPFRNASSSFLLSPTRNDNDGYDLFASPSSASTSLSEGEQQRREHREEQQHHVQDVGASSSSASAFASAVYQKRRHRSIADPRQQYRSRGKHTTTTIAAGWIALCLILFLISFFFFVGRMTPVPLQGADYVQERHLWCIPWIGGWQIQVRAVRR